MKHYFAPLALTFVLAGCSEAKFAATPSPESAQAVPSNSDDTASGKPGGVSDRPKRAKKEQTSKSTPAQVIDPAPETNTATNTATDPATNTATETIEETPVDEIPEIILPPEETEDAQTGTRWFEVVKAQVGAPTKVVLIVDNSSSMADEQEALAQGISKMIDGITTENVTFSLFSTTTHSYEFAPQLSSDPLGGGLVYPGNTDRFAAASAFTNYSRHTDYVDVDGKLVPTWSRLTFGLAPSLLPGETITIKPGMTNAQATQAKNSIKDAIRALGTSGAPREAALCALHTILEELQLRYVKAGDRVAFVIVSDQPFDDSDACYLEYSKKVAANNPKKKITAHAAGTRLKLEMRAKKDNMDTAMSVTRTVVKDVFDCAAQADLCNAAGVTATCSAKQRAALVAFAYKDAALAGLVANGMVEDPATANCSSTYGADMVGFVEPKMQLEIAGELSCRDPYEDANGQVWANAIAYLQAKTPGISFNVTASLSPGSNNTNEPNCNPTWKPYKEAPVAAQKTYHPSRYAPDGSLRSLRDAVIAKADELFGPSGYSIAAYTDLTAETANDDKALASLVERSPTPDMLFDITDEDYSGSLAVVRQFLQDAPQLKYALALNAEQQLSHVIVENEDGTEREIFDWFFEDGVLTLPDGSVQVGERLRLEVF